MFYCWFKICTTYGYKAETSYPSTTLRAAGWSQCIPLNHPASTLRAPCYWQCGRSVNLLYCPQGARSVPLNHTATTPQPHCGQKAAVCSQGTLRAHCQAHLHNWNALRAHCEHTAATLPLAVWSQCTPHPHCGQYSSVVAVYTPQPHCHHPSTTLRLPCKHTVARSSQCGRRVPCEHTAKLICIIGTHCEHTAVMLKSMGFLAVWWRGTLRAHCGHTATRMAVWSQGTPQSHCDHPSTTLRNGKGYHCGPPWCLSTLTYTLLQDLWHI